MPSIAVRTVEQAREAVAELYKAKYTAWDSESKPRVPTSDPKLKKQRALDPLQNEIVIIQAYDGKNTYIFYPEVEFGWTRIADAIRGLLEDWRKLKIGQNLKFDAKQFLHHLNIRICNVWDTMNVEKVLNAGVGFSVSLANITYRRLGKKRDKSFASSFDKLEKPEDEESEEPENEELSDEQEDYAVQDVEDLFPIYEQQLAEVVQLDLVEIVNLENELTPILADMELAGFLVDRQKWQKLIKEFEHERDKAFINFYNSLMTKRNKKGLGDWEIEDRLPFFNTVKHLFSGMQPGSTTQLKNLFNNLLKRLGFKVMGKYNKEILDSTSAKAIAIFKAQCRDNKMDVPPFIEALNATRKWNKLIDSFGDKLLTKINPVDGRIHPTFNQIVDTGRLSCREPNLQQMPKRDPIAKKIRTCFIAGPGNVIVKYDYAAQELRVVAAYSGDRNMKQAFINGEDLHKRTASQMYKKALDEVTDLLRSQAKNIGFGIVYGMAEVGLSLRLDITREEARELLRLYLDVFPELEEWLKQQDYNGIANRVAFSALGRRRKLGYYAKADDDEEEVLMEMELDNKGIGRIQRLARNTPIQASSADMTKKAITIIHPQLIELQIGRTILTVHDEIVFEVDEERLDEAIVIIENGMREAEEYVLHTKLKSDVPADFEGSVAKSWS